jgi:selenocysteine-specific elongation factor
MPSLVLGTAGHIDHGKSSLIQALTGTDPDRLAEEKERGITIELGFARLELPSGRSMGVVDVPGHERFVRQMVAGATGIDVVMLVVAADDGVMPQTREHLAIIDLLGIERGVVALTKTDLAEEDWVDLVAEDVRTLLVGTGIEGAPIIPVSAKTGEGLGDVLEALDHVAEEAPSRQASMAMRLPVDRVFTISGAGTVVTGTLWSGVARKDDPVELYPSGEEGRVRGVQVHSESVDKAGAGQRVALNIAGLDTDDISRGDIVAAPGTLTVTDRFDARVTYLGLPDDDKPLETGVRMHVHHGTREVIGRVLLMEAEVLRPGESGLAQIRLEEPLAPRYEDRFILRSYSPVHTVGGGVVLDALPPRRTTLKAHEHELLDALLEHDTAAATTGLLASRGVPMTSVQVAAALGIARADVADELNRAELQRLKVGKDTYFVTGEALNGLLSAIDGELLAFHESDSSATGMAESALRDRVDARMNEKVFDAVLEFAAERGVAVVSGGRVGHPEAASTARAEQADAGAALLDEIRAQGLQPSSVSELAQAAGIDPNVARNALTQLVLDKQVVRLGPEMHFDSEAIDDARQVIATRLADGHGATAGELRDALGVTRKHAIPLLEYFDAQGLTRRDDDLRYLR